MMKPKASAKPRPGVDWEAVRRQMDEANQNLKSSEDISPAALEQAWARRSAKIAHKTQEEQPGDTIQVAIIGLDNELYGLDVHHIFEIRALESITFVPRVSAWVLGVVNWRGRILSVIDLRRFLGLPSNHLETKTKNTRRLIVVQAGEMEVGIRADEVFLIESIPVSKIRADAGDTSGINPEFVDGIFTRVGQDETQQVMVLLNLPALLAAPSLVVREEIL